MSRESDLALLGAMKEEITAIYSLSDKCKGNMARCEALKEERDNPTPPPVATKPVNAEEKLRKEYAQDWTARCMRTKWIKLICVILNALIIIGISVIFYLDFFGAKEIILPASVIAANVNEEYIYLISIAQGVMALVLILLPMLIIRGED